jgi:hypothetical protein
MALPPDLGRVGDELVAAAARSLRARRRRTLVTRWAATILIAALAYAALTPARLGPAQSSAPGTPILAFSTASTVSYAGCDQPRGARFGLPRACAQLALARSPRATLPHGTSLVRE